jgi:hypothetical protein
MGRHRQLRFQHRRASQQNRQGKTKLHYISSTHVCSSSTRAKLLIAAAGANLLFSKENFQERKCICVYQTQKHFFISANH